ncbi:MAG: DNA starvation/stationary phase protection protein, partial [Flavobacteriales bacterium]|nr:DNA starvation/stationary phase protection protein [Flavobacteriales bacterium]
MMDLVREPKEKQRRHAKLGFQNLEASKVVNGLNMLLANYAIHYQKLRNFHWNVEGPDFFDIHEKFEEQYNFTKETIDTLAERVRVFGKKPLSTLREYLDISEIKEVEADFKSSMMVSEILNDFEIILTHLTDVYDTAAEIGDVGT